MQQHLEQERAKLQQLQAEKEICVEQCRRNCPSCIYTAAEKIGSAEAKLKAGHGWVELARVMK